MDLTTVFISELVGTMILILFGIGVCASLNLEKSKAAGAGWSHLNWAWGLAVMFGIVTAYKSGGHLNPAITFGFWVSGVEEFVPGIPANAMSVLVYCAGQFVGAFIGAVLVFIAFYDQFVATPDKAKKLGTFAIAPEIRHPLKNFVTEVICTFPLTLLLIAGTKITAYQPGEPANIGFLTALGSGLLVVVIGMSLGGPTGYAINPTRDIAPRLVHQLLPIPDKGPSDWGYALITFSGPMTGGILGGLISTVVF